MKSKENCRLSDIEYENCIKANKEGRCLQCTLSINKGNKMREQQFAYEVAFVHL